MFQLLKTALRPTNSHLVMTLTPNQLKPGIVSWCFCLPHTTALAENICCTQTNTDSNHSTPSLIIPPSPLMIDHLSLAENIAYPSLIKHPKLTKALIKKGQDLFQALSPQSPPSQIAHQASLEANITATIARALVCPPNLLVIDLTLDPLLQLIESPIKHILPTLIKLSRDNHCHCWINSQYSPPPINQPFDCYTLKPKSHLLQG